MKSKSQPIIPENLNLSPEQLERLKNGHKARIEIWDGHPMVITTDELPPRKTQEKYKFVVFDYDAQLELAKKTRNALLAVMAELHKLQFLSWDKKAPIEFNNSVLRSLGFNHHDRIRSLKALENAGWVTVQWRKRKSPLVIIVQGFWHGL